MSLDTNIIKSILDYGASGLALYFIYRNFNLLKWEQDRKEPRKVFLDRINRLNIIIVFLIVVTGAFRLVETYLVNGDTTSISEENLVNCIDSIKRIDTESNLSDISLQGITIRIKEHVAVCGPLLNRIKDRFGEH